MKMIYRSFLTCAGFVLACAPSVFCQNAKKTSAPKPLITHLYTADPSAHVFEGKIYIYPSHDVEATWHSGHVNGVIS